LIPAVIALLLAGGGAAAAIALTGGNGNSGKASMGTNAAGTTAAMGTSGAMTTGSGTTTGMEMSNGNESASQVMQSVIATYKWDCTKNPIDAPTGADITEDCKTGVPQFLQINAYPTKRSLDDEYAKLLALSPVKRNEGACSAGTWGGEQKWFHGLNELGGRVFCYLSNNTTYLTWTGGNRFLMVARMNGIDHPTLYYWWRRNVRHELV
jgi:hypothetical protein